MNIEKPRKEVIECFGQVLMCLGTTRNFFPVPQLLEPVAGYTPEPLAMMEALQWMTDEGYLERYLKGEVVQARFTKKGVLFSKKAFEIRASQLAEHKESTPSQPPTSEHACGPSPTATPQSPPQPRSTRDASTSSEQ